MQHLQVVGLTADRGSLVLKAKGGTESIGYVLDLDEQLLDVVADVVGIGRPRTGADGENQGQKAGSAQGAPVKSGSARSESANEDTRPDRRPPDSDADGQTLASGRPGRGASPPLRSRLSPREMQARLRAGRSVAEVAMEAGVEAAWVDRFAGPIQAEQARVVARARDLVFSRPRAGPSTAPLGTSVRVRLADKGIGLPGQSFDDAWAAYHLEGTRWIVQFRYRHRRRDHLAEWEVDLADGAISGRNRVASELGHVDRPHLHDAPASELLAPAASAEATKNGADAKQEGAGRSARRPRAMKSAGTRTAFKKAAGKKTASKTGVRKGAATTSAASQAAASKTAASKTAASKTAASKTAASKTAASKTAASQAAARKAAGASTRRGDPSVARRAATARPRQAPAGAGTKRAPRPAPARSRSGPPAAPPASVTAQKATSKAGATKAGATKAGATKAGATKAGATKAGATKAGAEGQVVNAGAMADAAGPRTGRRTKVTAAQGAAAKTGAVPPSSAAIGAGNPARAVGSGGASTPPATPGGPPTEIEGARRAGSATPPATPGEPPAPIEASAGGGAPSAAAPPGIPGGGIETASPPSGRSVPLRAPGRSDRTRAGRPLVAVRRRAPGEDAGNGATPAADTQDGGGPADAGGGGPARSGSG